MFKQALACVFDRSNDGGDSFYNYCVLSDLCGGQLAESKKVQIFYKVDKKLKIIFNLKEQGALAVPVLKAGYPAVKEILNKESFLKLIDTATKAYLREESVQSKTMTEENINGTAPSTESRTKVVKRRIKPVAANVKKASGAKKTNNAKKTNVIKTTNRADNDAVPTAVAIVPQKKHNVSKIAPFVAIAIVLTLIAICLFIVFGRYISPAIRQFIIGIFAVPVLLSTYFAVVLIVSKFINDITNTDSYVYPLIAAATTIVAANAVLRLMFNADYEIIFCFVSAMNIPGFVIAAVMAQDENKKAATVVSVAGTILSVVVIVLSIIL